MEQIVQMLERECAKMYVTFFCTYPSNFSIFYINWNCTTFLFHNFGKYVTFDTLSLNFSSAWLFCTSNVNYSVYHFRQNVYLIQTNNVDSVLKSDQLQVRLIDQHEGKGSIIEGKQIIFTKVLIPYRRTTNSMDQRGSKWQYWPQICAQRELSDSSASCVSSQEPTKKWKFICKTIIFFVKFTFGFWSHILINLEEIDMINSAINWEI